MSEIFSRKMIQSLEAAAEHAENLSCAIVATCESGGSPDLRLDELFKELSILSGLCALNGFGWDDVIVAVETRAVIAMAKHHG